MKLDSQHLSLHVRPRQLVSVANAGRDPLSVSVTRGAVWITRDGDSEDIVLESGQRLAAHEPGALLIYGLADADLEIDEPPGASA